jgi:hypothetical protein
MQIHDMLNIKVHRAISLLPNAGFGLFAKVDIAKDSVVCTYGGRLIPLPDAKYEDPTYIVDFELGHGFKLVGDDLSGDLGCYANGEHHLNVDLKRNAKFAISKTKRILSHDRGMFKIIATRLIHKDEEIIINYGAGYWTTIGKWDPASPVMKPLAIQHRDQRAAKRRKV